MKKFTLGVLVTVSMLCFVACSKDKSTLSARGYWFGMYGQGTSNPNIPYGFLFREDGTMRVYSNFSDTATGNKAEGIYHVSGMTVTGSYTYFTGMTGNYSFKASADEDDDETLNGTYGMGTAQTGGGTFYLFKQ